MPAERCPGSAGAYDFLTCSITASDYFLDPCGIGWDDPNPPPVRMSISISRTLKALNYLMHMEEVEGWLSATTALAMLEIGLCQETEGVTGDLAEIGVHHGKSFMALAAAARPNETVHAIDVFDRQHLNVDNSGCGNRDILLAHLNHFFPSARVRLVSESSAEVRGKEEAFALANLRFLSIDGGHTLELTLNDLHIANTCLVEGGVCCLDDVLHYHWTGVLSGLFKFLESNARGDIVPFAYFPNKLFLCRPKFKERYMSHMRTVMDYTLEKTDREFWQTSIDVYGERWPHVSKTFSNFASLVGAEAAAAADERARQAERQATDAEQHAAATELAAARSAEGVYNSTSWRLTSPVRVIGRLLGRP